ncbi:hypothetical protein PISMIDRAFT_13048 [Pisolithus microcarpus 441]|uniref:Uncharacterized protein n=1 Tax=Pisolithus microcarpus 441 TaxID=765257 RepID=A0A0C9YUG1_9AGAM|nr:hypothetical protein PISMIDRAFT_13048 [Pisolithus microcarpus 441]
MPWEMALPDELEDKLGDSVAVKMAKFDERQRRQCLALQRELEAEEWRKAKEAERIHKEQEAKAKRIRELEAERKWLEEETRRAQQAGGSSSQQVLASTGKAVDRSNGCSMCIKAGKECKPRTGHSKSCVWCQKLKAKCDLITWMMDMEKRPVEMTSPRGGEKQKCHRKSKALMEVVIDMDDGDDEAMEDTPDVETKDSVAEVLDRRLGEVVKLLQKNNTAIETLARDVQDLSGVLEESFEALKAVMMALVSRAQNANNV